MAAKKVPDCPHCRSKKNRRVIRCPACRKSYAIYGTGKKHICPHEDCRSPHEQAAATAKAAAGDRHREAARQSKAVQNYLSRDIAPLPTDKINWERRLAAKFDLKIFAETYMPDVFYLGWSDDQLKCLAKVERVFIGSGGKFCMAMPRGGGKTAICRAGILWGTAYGHKRFPFFIGSKQPAAVDTLEFIRAYWFGSRKLLEDFPEIAYPVVRLENRYHLARGQLFNGRPTHIEWSSDSVRYPTLMLTKTEAKPYLDNDPDSIRERDGLYFSVAGGVVIATAGIDGAIRGEAPAHPVTLEQLRPDCVLVDDVQKDQRAESPTACDKIERLIDGAIEGLSGPDRTISGLMPCTVIREGDVADTYLDQTKKPEWQGERCSLVTHWPDGITDMQISMDTEPGRLWNRYDELRKDSLRRHGDMRLATDFYKRHRREMDAGFRVSWKDRFDPHTEISAQQYAMNLRLKNPEAFASEYQNRGKKLHSEGVVLITADQFAENTIALPQRHLPVDCQHLGAFIDVQNEILFYCVLGVAPDFTGVICDYGTWPELSAGTFAKWQLEGWSMLTRKFFEAYPEQKANAFATEGGKIRAPLEAKIYFALSQCVRHLRSLEFIREDGNQTVMQIEKIAIDSKWGQAAGTIKRFIRERGGNVLIPYEGAPFPPTNKQIEEYTLTSGWLFEHQRHPHIRDPKWIVRPAPDGSFYMQADVNRLKDFIFNRISSPPGTPGAIALFDAPPHEHSLFASHVCNSEYPDLVIARGRKKNLWKQRESRPDNDWLDCLAGSAAVCSLLGASLQRVAAEDSEVIVQPKRERRSLSNIARRKREQRGGM